MSFDTINFKEEKVNIIDMISNKWMLITAGNKQKANTMTASWGAMGELWGMDIVQVFIRPSRYTLSFVENEDYFSLCFFDDEFKEKLAYLGRVSGREENKIKNAKLTVNTEEAAPFFNQARYVFIIKKLYKEEIKRENFVDKALFDKVYTTNDVHFMYTGEIIKVLKNTQC